jgi:HK97 family phage major capsid protein
MKRSDRLKAKKAEIGETRDSVVAKMKAMHSTLESEQRDFTSEERAAFDALKAKKDSIDRIDCEIAEAEAVEAEDRHAEGRDLSTGLTEGEVRALLPEQRMASLVHHTGPKLTLRDGLRGKIFGNWQHVDPEARATMEESTGALGGFMVPNYLSASLIDLARNKSILVPAGALTIPMPAAEMTFVRVVTDPTPSQHKEHQTITESAPTFAPIKAKAMATTCLVRMSVELFEDAPQAAETVDHVIAAAMALEMDRLGAFGAGTSEPRGLFNTDGVNVVSMGANGATPTNWDAYLDAILAIETANGTPNAVVMSPRSKRTLAGLKDTTGQPLTPPKEFTDLRRLVSNQIPTNQTQGNNNASSSSIVGDFSQLGFAVRTGLMMEATRTGGDSFAKMEILVRAYLRFDVVVFRPQHFVKVLGIKA